MTAESLFFKVLKAVLGLMVLASVVGLIIAFMDGGWWAFFGALFMAVWMGAGTLCADMGKVEENPWRAYSWYAVVLDDEQVLGPELSPGFQIATLLGSREAAEMLVAAAPAAQRERLKIVRVFVR